MLQPNFEAIKTAFYQSFADSEIANSHILRERIRDASVKPFYLRLRDFKDDFNKWLDRLDIRQAGTLIRIMKEHKKPLPKWAENGQYVIDYNNKGMLDLLKTNTAGS